MSSLALAVFIVNGNTSQTIITIDVRVCKGIANKLKPAIGPNRLLQRSNLDQDSFAFCVDLVLTPSARFGVMSPISPLESKGNAPGITSGSTQGTLSENSKITTAEKLSTMITAPSAERSFLI